MGNRRVQLAVVVAFVVGLGCASFALAGGRNDGNGRNKGSQSGTFSAVLSGHEETPAVHTSGQGTLSLTIKADNTMAYRLTYSGLSTPAMMAHVHLGQPDVAGGIAFWLCGGGGKPACPPGNTSTPATVSGTIAAADVLAIPGQGLAAGDLAGIVQEIRAGFTYANIHTTAIGTGEIRGQINGRHGGDHNHNNNNNNKNNNKDDDD